MDIGQIQATVPQRFPFLMLDRVTELVPGESLVAYKNVSIDEAYFNGHFPGNPVFPGALTAEAMAQAACILIKKSIPDLAATVFYVTSMNIRFSRVVVPGDRLEIRIRAVKMVRMGGIFETAAFVGGDAVAKGEMTFACR